MQVLSVLPGIPSKFLHRRALARILSTFLCAVAIVLRPVSRFGGQYAFLVLVIKELFFSVQADLAQQVEVTVLNVTGALFGIGASTLAKFIASQFDRHSVYTRLIPAIRLLRRLIPLIVGFLRSRLPRLLLATRITFFVSIWILTNDSNPADNVNLDATDFLWVTLAPAVICLFSSMLLLHWTSAHFGDEVSAAFVTVRNCLSMSLDKAFSNYGAKDTASTGLRQMHKELLQKSISINAAYSEAAFELRIGRLSVKSIKPLIGIIEHLRRELSWGMSFSTANFARLDAPGHHSLDAFKDPILDLGHALLMSMKAVEHLILLGFGHPETADPSGLLQHMSVAAAAQQLLEKRDALRNQLQAISDEVDLEQRTAEHRTPLSRDFFDLCLFVISLLQMAHEMRNALQVTENLMTIYESSSLRLWYPHLSMAWLGVTPRTFILDERTGIPLDNEGPEPDNNLSSAETEEGLAEQGSVTGHYEFSSAPISATIQSEKYSKKSVSARHPRSLLHYLWRTPFVLYIRLRLSKIFRAVQHSNSLRHALKNAAGVALLSLPAFLPGDSPGRRWYTSVHGPWMLITYIWVLETNTGATWRVGYLRISGTIIGAVYAYITWLICKTNPYGMITLVTAADIPITWIIMYTKVSSMGVVMSITLPPIVFARYIDPSQTIPVASLAVIRGLMIGAGIIAALLVAHFAFPRHPRVLFLSNTSRTLSLLSQLYLALSRNLFTEGHVYLRNDKYKTLRLEMEIRSALHRLSILMTAMDDELSLVPKPMRLYREIASNLQKVLDLLTGLRKVRENIPRKETVASVFKERRELVSCVCISLFACEHAFRARQPLPQFLPSARHALEILTSHVDERIKETRHNDPHSMGFSLVYAFAEKEVLKDLVETIEELLSLTRKAFGSSTWLTYVPQGYRSHVSVHDEGSHGWYSTF
ncbi:hypothetical protein OE88DRAFT_1780799 [Heliocybe sulcata]|uniref:Integral membrane bound transporter domain-containing protein n=1 Tax=Heliocybe sulcata TaxID=5364 RepID=A0A5C3NEK7_9AGAM|nr:hypothetical protein OE88DRAFT_1780799 [Heliocybe sulcata]